MAAQAQAAAAAQTAAATPTQTPRHMTVGPQKASCGSFICSSTAAGAWVLERGPQSGGEGGLRERPMTIP